MMRWIGSLAVVAAGLLAACSSSSEPVVVAAEEVEGCYAVALGEWAPPPDEALPPPPEKIELKAELGESVLEAGRRLVRPSPDEGPRAYMWSWWEPLPGDSVKVVWSTGFTGILMSLAGDGQDLEGEAELFYDYPAEQSRAAVTLARTACG